jgi:hypothetical protein
MSLFFINLILSIYWLIYLIIFFRINLLVLMILFKKRLLHIEYERQHFHLNNIRGSAFRYFSELLQCIYVSHKKIQIHTVTSSP